MFDLGLDKLMVIAVVGIVVLGPERLPKVARFAGHLWGKGQKILQEVRTQIEQTQRAIQAPLDASTKLVQDVSHDFSKLSQEFSTANDLSSLQIKNDTSLDWDVSTPALDHQTLMEHQTLLSATQKRRQAYQTWRVQSGRQPQWYKLLNQQPKQLQSAAARTKRHKVRF